MRLFKYLPATFADSVVSRGNLLFRNLTYFRQHEGIRRGDPLEGFHRDNPDTGITITFNTTEKTVTNGDLSFLNFTNTDLIFVFCLSTSLNEKLFEEFETDCCIEIFDVNELVRRTKIAVRKLLSAHHDGLRHGLVNYYADNAPASFDIHDPKVLAFAKGFSYQHQCEYRLTFGTKKAYSLTKRIVLNKSYDFVKEAQSGEAKEKHLQIGKISDISRIHRIE